MIIRKSIVARIKKDLRKEVPGLKSMHVDEAIARGFGARTYAALCAGFDGDEYDLVVDIHAHRFLGFMIERGYGQAADAACRIFQSLAEQWCLPEDLDASGEAAREQGDPAPSAAPVQADQAVSSS
jgi:hypothetical protein